ncbi:MAG: RNA methyltransferase [Clostridiales Family XIII bacterium]|jgi:TrmH family RNA methyltransferase|nr:RNA methyltransferase [Clostridiales Family XIII bacterium]
MRIRITSGDNRTVKLAKLLSTKKGRDRCGAYLIEGPKLLAEALDHDAEILFAFFCEERPGGPPRCEASAERLANTSADVLLTTERIFRSIADTETPQGVLAAVGKPVCDAAGFFSRVADGNVLVLDCVRDPGNVGALIRTADAAGFGVLAASGTGDPYAPKAVRAAAGALFRVPLLLVRDADAALALLAAAGKRVVVADARGGRSCHEADLARDLALVIGNEGRGVSRAFAAGASLAVRVPMPGGAESLNAAAAAAVLLFESVRQRAAAEGGEAE